RGEGRVLIGGAVDVVKANDGDIVWNPQPVLMDGAHGDNGCKIIKGEDCSKGTAGSEQLLGGVVSEIGRGQIVLELNDQFRRNRPPRMRGYLGDHFPANFAVRGERLALNDGNIRVAESAQMLERKFSSSAMIEDDAGNAFYVVVARNCHHG